VRGDNNVHAERTSMGGMRIHHIAMRTQDLERLEAFYAGVLGLGVQARQGPRAVWLDADGTILMLERAEAEEPLVAEEAMGRSMELVAFAIEPTERAALVERLARATVLVEAETDYTVYVRDPDGRRIGLSHYPATGS
jgi:glyoxylase I family protein